MRKVLFAGVLVAGAVLLPAPAQAAPTCNGLPATIFGTEGNDTIVGSGGDDVILAGGGNDTVFAVAGNDTVCLGQGDDRLFGGRGDDTFVAEAVADGADLFDGGSDRDLARYSARSTPLVVTMDGVANDGAAGEGDNIDATAVEFLVGGSADDTLTGNAFPNRIFGGLGNDTLFGLDSDDDLQGQGGDDLLIGGLGNDFLLGGVGNDRLSGQKGADVVQGAGGDDTYLAANELDGSDTFSGGPGTDTANYSARQNQSRGVLSLSLDGRANDGEADEDEVIPGIQRDSFSVDVENLIGGAGSNIISGDIQNNVLIGGPRNDFIIGADRVPGNDRIDGQLGTDTCTADARDVVERCEG